MDDEADVGLVDAHTEGVGADHNAGLPCLPGSLTGAAHPRLEPGVIEGSADALRLQERCGFLTAAAAAHVHDATPLHPVADVQELAALVFRFADDIAEVRTLEAGLEEVALAEAQLVHNVLRNLRGGGGGKGYHGGVNGFTETADLEIVRAEVIAPLRDAVGLVDHYIINVQDFQIAAEQTCAETLRGDIKELAASVGGIVQGVVHLMAVHSRMHGDGPDAAGLKILHLVFHKGDKRSDHEGGAVTQQGRDLKTDALASAGGQDSEGVATLQGGVHDLFLHGPEGVVAPNLL